MTKEEALDKLAECDERLKILDAFECVRERSMTKTPKQAAKLKKQAMKIIGSLTIETRDLLREWVRATLDKSETHK